MDVEKESRFYGSALRELALYVELRLAPRIDRIGTLSQRHDALWLIVLCARSLVEAIVHSARPAAFRAQAVLCRSLWEHWVDFETLRRSGETAAAQWHAFSEIQAWNHFVRVRDARSKLGREDGPLPIDGRGVATRVKELLAQHYGVALSDARDIRQWNLKSLFTRACDLGPDEELYYREFYSMLSWATHGNPTGVAGMPREFLDRSSFQWRVDAFDHFLKMIDGILLDVGLDAEERPEVARIVAIAEGDYEAPGAEGEKQ